MTHMLYISSVRRAYEIFDDILEFSRDPVIGISRQGYGPVEQKVHDYVISWAKEHNLEISVDRCGNLFVTLPGSDRTLPAYMSGSHADSVPQGGHYDGLAGIVAPMICIEQIQEKKIQLRRDITLVVFRLEESSYFGKAYVGSLALTGQLREKDLELKNFMNGKTLRETITEAGLNPEDFLIPSPTIDLKRIAAFTELHIEQGPTLDAQKEERAGIVSGIRGNIRHKNCRCTGVTAHSGAVDRPYRHDAVMALSHLLVKMDQHWKEWLDAGEDLVFTVGVVKTGPAAAIAVIPGEVSFCLDIRSLHEETLERFHALFIEESKAIEAQYGVSFDFGAILRTKPATLDSELSAYLVESAKQSSLPAMVLPSGAGHDSAVLANAGVPASMIFVANQNGSHNPHEKMRIADFLAGTQILLTAMIKFDEKSGEKNEL